METKKKFLKALLIGAVLGVTYTFILDPIINKPIKKVIGEVVE